MYGRERRVLLCHYLEQGLSKAEPVRTRGVNRRTLYRELDNEPVRYAARPPEPADPVVRFDTPPGLQAQVDFAEFRLPWGKR